MKPLVLVRSAAGLALSVAACGGGGAQSAGPAPSVPVETGPPATTPGDYVDVGATPQYFHQAAEYSAQADAICKTATDKLEAPLAELPERADLSVTGPYYQPFEDLAYELSGKALAELRALRPPEAAMAVNPVALCSHRGGSQVSASGPTRAEFIAQARDICRAVGSRGEESNEAPARVVEEALAQLRALPQPEADRALLEEGFYQVVEQEIYALRESAAAAAAGDTARAFLLSSERVHLTHQRDGFAGAYGLMGCPVPLPA